jgi:hypothetical protein
MKSSIVLAAVLLMAATFGAHADQSNDVYRDMIRPNGQKRSAAVFQSDLDGCYQATGASRFARDTPAFRQCMLQRGYQWSGTRVARSRHGGGQDWTDVSTPTPADPPPPVTYEPPPPPAPVPAPQPVCSWSGPPDTGSLVCY